MLLPSDGTHGLFSPKSLLFLSAAFSIFLLIMVRQRFHPKQLLHGVFLAFFLVFLILWMAIGIANPITQISSTFDQAKLFLITAAVPLMTLYLYKEELIIPQQIIRIAILSNFLYCLCKLSLILFHFCGALNMWDLLKVANFRVQQMDIVGSLQRLQTSVDISTPFLFMFVLFSKRLELKFPPLFRQFYLLLTPISNFFTFSRYLLFVQGAALILYIFSLTSKKFIQSAALSAICLIFAIASFGPQNFLDSLEKRFFSKSSYYSDQARVDQINALLEQTAKTPYTGSGLGAHAPKAIRDRKLLHSYEVQWAAFLMQLGIAGVSILLIFLSFIAIPFLIPPMTRISLAFFCLFLLWILSGFTNPFLISLQSGIIYSLFLMAIELLPNSKIYN